jgi:hypothetical protein
VVSSPTPDDAYLAGLAEEYLALIKMTDAGHGDPDDRHHAASARAVVHDQILQALGLTRADDFDPVAWAKDVLARRPAPADPYANLPFETNQPLERYRLHHGMGLAEFVTFLGIPEEVYLRLLAGDQDVPPAVTRTIADRLGVPPWLINECAPPLSAEMLARALAAGDEADRLGWIEVDTETLEPTSRRFDGQGRRLP